MRLTILLFGPASTAAGAASVGVEVEEGASCERVRTALIAQHEPLAAIARSGRLAVNGSYVDESTIVGESDELALIALVSGG